MDQTDSSQSGLMQHGQDLLKWANSIWSQLQEAKVIEPQSINDTLSLQNVTIPMNTTMVEKSSFSVVGISNLINNFAEKVSMKLLSPYDISLYGMDFLIPYQSISFIIIAVGLIFLGSFMSIQSIPTTALTPTDVHPLFDPTDKDIRHDCKIINKPTKSFSTTKCAKDQKSKDDLGNKAEKEEDDSEGFNPFSSFHSNHLNEWHAIIMPFTAGLSLFILYKLFHGGRLYYATTILRYNMILLNLTSTMGVTSFIIRFILRHLCHFFQINSLYLAPRYRISIVDDNKDIHCMGQSPYVLNFQYIDSLSGKLGYDEIIKYLNKPSNYSMKQEYYYREFSPPGNIKSNQQISNVYIDWIWIFSLVIGLISSFCFYICPTNWLVMNMVSFNITIWSISQINLKNLKTGILILFALFLYDIYFVFHTDMMVTVAQNLELPVKILLPTRLLTDDKSINKVSFSLLGTGDIVLPGFFISLCYKYDIWKWHNVHDDEEFHLLRLPRYMGRYLISSLMGYISGLIICMIFLHKYQIGQPALLYIVPSTIIMVLSVAYLSGDLSEFWNFKYDTIDYKNLDTEKVDDTLIDSVTQWGSESDSDEEVLDFEESAEDQLEYFEETDTEE